MEMGTLYKFLGLCGRIFPVLYAIIGLCLIIVVHEFGHFLFARMFGIHTPTFSVGFGPVLAEKKVGKTNFVLSAIPLGGFVEIAGLAEPGQGEQKHAAVRDQESFATKPYWQKLLVILGGIAFNMLFAYIAIIGLLAVGTPKHAVAVKEVMENSVAARAGVRGGDIITSIGEWNIAKTPQDLGSALKEIQETEGPLVLGVTREGTLLSLSLTVPKVAPEGQGKLGIALDLVPSGEIERLPLGAAIREGIARVHHITVQTIWFLGHLVSERTLKGAGGPIMIISESARQAQQGFVYLLFLLAVISINLAIINLIPIPALDGGQLLLISIESAIGRELPEAIKNAFFIASWLFLLSLIVLFTYNDIKRLFGY